MKSIRRINQLNYMKPSSPISDKTKNIWAATLLDNYSDEETLKL